MVSRQFPKTACTEVQLPYSWPEDFRGLPIVEKQHFRARKETRAARQTIPQYSFLRANEFEWPQGPPCGGSNRGR